MTKSASAIGWKLDREQRRTLLGRFPPHYAEPIADHVTLEAFAEGKPLPAPVDATLIGRVDDESGVEAMIVAIDGDSDRPDGSTFHITWSLGPGRQARDSNDALKTCEWQMFDQPIALSLVPARF